MNKSISYLLVFSFAFVFRLNAQISICGLTGYDAQQNTINCLLSDQTSKSNVVDIISSQIGIAPNFVFKSCPNTINAKAIVNPFKNNARYILFDFDYFGQLYDNNPASTIFIVAHEIGHHINGHLNPKNYNNILEKQKLELESDYFAGFIMFKLGFAEGDIIRTINGLPDPESDYSTHPRNSKRLDYALRGFLNEANKYKAEVYRLRDQFENETKIKLYDDLIKALNAYALEDDQKQLDIALYIISKIGNEHEVIKPLDAYANYKKGNYGKALNFYKMQFLKTGNDSDLQYFLDIIAKTQNQDSDIVGIVRNLENNSTNLSILHSLGIYFKQINDAERSKSVLKKAYNLVKNKPDDLLKADIMFSYARTFYDEKLENSAASSFAKTLLLKAKSIYDKYPDNSYYRFYYNSLLFHLGNTQMLDNDYLGAVDTYNLLLEKEKKRTDYIYKANASLGNIYFKNENYPEAIQYFTNAINSTDDNTFKMMYLHQRGQSYFLNNNPNLGLKDLREACKMGFADSCEILDETNTQR